MGHLITNIKATGRLIWSLYPGVRQPVRGQEATEAIARHFFVYFFRNVSCGMLDFKQFLAWGCVAGGRFFAESFGWSPTNTVFYDPNLVIRVKCFGKSEMKPCVAFVAAPSSISQSVVLCESISQSSDHMMYFTNLQKERPPQ